MKYMYIIAKSENKKEDKYSHPEITAVNILKHIFIYIYINKAISEIIPCKLFLKLKF